MRARASRALGRVRHPPRTCWHFSGTLRRGRGRLWIITCDRSYLPQYDLINSDSTHGENSVLVDPPKCLHVDFHHISFQPYFGKTSSAAALGRTVYQFSPADGSTLDSGQWRNIVWDGAARCSMGFVSVCRNFLEQGKFPHLHLSLTMEVRTSNP